MEFVYGTVLLVAAIFLLGFARFAVTRHENSSWVRRFAATETMALIITTLSAFGIAFLCVGVASSQNGLGYLEFGASIGVIALSVVGVIRIFRMTARTGTPAAKPAAAAPKPGTRAAV